MKTIIVPTDFSSIADNALRFATDMAKHIRASLLLLHVYQVPVAVSDMPMVTLNADEMKADSERDLAEAKDRIVQSTMGSVPVFTQARLGSVSTELEDICKSMQPFAVVMGTHGDSRTMPTVFGSNSLAAMRRLHVPVMLIPPGVSFRPVQKIGLACDMQKVAPSTPEKEIKTIVKEFGAELHVLNVDRRFEHFAPSSRQEAATLQNMLEELHPHYHFIYRDNIEESLDDFAQRNDLDFLIVVPKRHAFPEGLFHRSCSKKLAAQAHVPVMAIHEPV
ncbi:MAG: universal stress protein [Bacteroidetes bacterium]|nr:universal stress protein [Bacteroidota bacterium]